MYQRRRVLSVFLAVCLLVSGLSMTSYADNSVAPEGERVLTIGALQTSRGTELSSKNRARTGQYDAEVTDLTFSVEGTEAMYGVFCYDESETFLGYTGWRSINSFDFKNGTKYFRVVMKYTDDRVISDTELLELTQYISFTPRQPEEEPMLEIGALQTSRGSELSSKNRARTGQYDIEESALSLSVEGTEAMYGVFCYDETSTFLGYTGWRSVNSFELKNGTRYFRVVMKYTDDRVINNTELQELASYISITPKQPEEEPLLEIGALQTSRGSELSSKNRARTGQYDAEVTDLIVSVEETEVMYGVFCYDESGAFLGYTGWRSVNSFDYKNGTRYFRVVLKYADDRVINDAELQNLEQYFSITPKQHHEDAYVVTFDAGSGAFGSGDSTYQISAPSGALYLNDIEEPVWEGHGFLCWKLNGKRVTRVNLTSDVTLTAEWVNLYKVTFNANGGEYDNGDAVFFEYYAPGTINVEDITPSRANYEFNGWMLNGSRVKKLRLTGDVELVAQWIPIIEVTYDANGGYWQFDEEPSFTTTVTREEPGLYYIGWHEPIRDDGYVFAGWTVDGEDLEFIDLSEPITVKAQWAKEYVVSYDPNGGSWYGDTDVRTETARAGDFWVDFEWPDNEDLDFVGWSTDPNATEAEHRFNYVVESNVTFYAIWRSNQDVEISYDANGGQWGDDTKTEFHFCRIGEYYRVGMYEPWREGYEFDGWLDANDNRVDGAEYLIEANTTYVFHAKWVKCYTITYDSNGGEWYWCDAVLDETRQIRYDSSITKDYSFNMESPWREGYRFIGWSLDGENLLEDPITLNEDNTTVYALWRKYVNVTYVTNIGAWCDWVDEYGNPQGDTRTSYTDYEITDEYTISGWWPQAGSDYKFLGYSTSANSNTVQYTPNQNVGILTENLTLYAVWQKRPKITFNANGGQWHDDTTTRVEYQEAGRKYYVRYEQPWRVGYDFIGWEDANGNLVDSNSPLTLVEGVEFVFNAKWEKQVVITYDANGGYWDNYETIYHDYAKAGEYYYVGMWYPYRRDADFAGWVDEDGNLVEGNEILLQNDVEYKFYAKWEEKIQVTYDANGGEWDYYEEWNGETATSRKRYEMPGEFYPGGDEPQKEGYWFIGWSIDGETRIEGPIMLSENITLKALWRKAATITYITKIGAWKTWNWDTETEEVFTQLERENYYYDLRVEGWWPECDDAHRFLGYTTVEDGNVVEYKPDQPLDVEENITLYAVWQDVPTVTYHAGDGAWGEGDEAEKTQVHWQDPGYHYYVRYESPYLEGFEFAGWVDSEGQSADDRLLEMEEGQHYDFYATWKKLLIVTYDANNGHWGYDEDAHDIEFQEAESGPYHVGYWFPERPGYRCLGWNTDPNATTGMGEWDTELTDGVTYYAIWEKVPTLTLDAGGDGYFGATEQTTTLEFRNGQTIGTDLGQLPEPWREGYRFIGWTINGEFVARRYRMIGDVTFTAAWVKICEVCYDADGGEFSNGEELVFETCDEGSFYVLQFADEPTKEGFVFDGWVLESGEYVNQFVVDDDVKFIATWIEADT